MIYESDLGRGATPELNAGAVNIHIFCSCQWEQNLNDHAFCEQKFEKHARHDHVPDDMQHLFFSDF